MQQVPSQVQDRVLVGPAPGAAMAAAVTPTTKEIPYDYVAKFTLRGESGNRVQDVINISTDGAFVAVAIGYSLIPAKLPKLPKLPVPKEEKEGDRDDMVMGLLRPFFPTIQALLDGLPVEYLHDLFEILLQDPRWLIECLLVRLCCGISFKYSIIDSGSGRELQNQAIHNIAGLGEPTGNRPFRPLAKPMLYMPRSTIRIEVEEVSEGPIFGYEDPKTQQRKGAQLFIVLHGYKILGYGTGLP